MYTSLVFGLLQQFCYLTTKEQNLQSDQTYKHMNTHLLDNVPIGYIYVWSIMTVHVCTRVHGKEHID